MVIGKHNVPPKEFYTCLFFTMLYPHVKIIPFKAISGRFNTGRNMLQISKKYKYSNLKA